MAQVLRLFGEDTKPPAPVPSTEKPRSYMRLSERLRTIAQHRNVEWDDHNPRKLMDAAWKGGLKDLYFANDGEVGADIMEEMMNAFCVDERIVRHELERLAHLEKASRARSKLEQIFQEKGIDVLVTKHVRVHVPAPASNPNKKVTVAEMARVLEDVHKISKGKQPKHRADVMNVLAKMISAKESKSRVTGAGSSGPMASSVAAADVENEETEVDELIAMAEEADADAELHESAVITLEAVTAEQEAAVGEDDSEDTPRDHDTRHMAAVQASSAAFGRRSLRVFSEAQQEKRRRLYQSAK